MQLFAWRGDEPPAPFKYSVVAIICLSAPPLLAIPHLKLWGWVLLGLTALALVTQYPSRFSKHMLVLAGVLGLLGIIPINTLHMGQPGTGELVDDLFV